MSDNERRTFTDDEALAFHRYPTPGKIAIAATKPMATQRDLSLAYSPGVAVPVLAIAKDPDAAYDYTSKGNLVAVVSNGTAILGLGDLGALASKPVMEGKGVLFKRFADVDAIDIEVSSRDPDEIITVVKNKRIVFQWPVSGDDYLSKVEMAFEVLDSGDTMVRIDEGGWHEDEVGKKASYGNAGGWMHMMCCLKAYLEYGINLRAGGAF